MKCVNKECDYYSKRYVDNCNLYPKFGINGCSNAIKAISKAEILKMAYNFLAYKMSLYIDDEKIEISYDFDLMFIVDNNSQGFKDLYKFIKKIEKEGE
jgi:hypothetical protein